MAQVEEEILKRLARRPDPDEVYFTLLSIFHEDMHGEAFIATRQTLGYPAPRLSGSENGSDGSSQDDAPWPGDVPIDGGPFHLGATPAEPFVFDNEKWAHPVVLRPVAIARAPVT